jgi:hypothetical protein
MQTSGSSVAGRAGLALVLFAACAGAALAAEASVVAVPAGNAYVVTAILVPGSGGAEVCGDTNGQGHIDFRIGFGSDLNLSVNGVAAGAFDPGAAYRVTVTCQRLGCEWFATTNVANQATGALVFQQQSYPILGSTEVRVAAEHVVQLTVQ